MFRKKTGDLGENLAVNYLNGLGFSIKNRNVRYKCGELDIVAEKEGILYLFEVRTTKKGLSSPLETIDYKKQNHVKLAAGNYIIKNNWNGPIEIGYIGIDLSNNPPSIECVLDEG